MTRIYWRVVARNGATHCPVRASMSDATEDRRQVLRRVDDPSLEGQDWRIYAYDSLIAARRASWSHPIGRFGRVA